MYPEGDKDDSSVIKSEERDYSHVAFFFLKSQKIKL